MRALHVATLVSPDGAFGGPIRVAVNLCKALEEASVSAHMCAGWRGYDYRPSDVDRVSLHAFRAFRAVPKSGFSGLIAPGLIRWFLSNASAYDVIHVHLARDLTTLPIARLASAMNKPLVVQTHGMVVTSHHPFAKPVDAAFTRPVLSSAGKVLYLTDSEAAQLGALGAPDEALEHLPNGVPSEEPQSTSQSIPTVLFLARMHPRKRPVNFLRAAQQLIDSGIIADFILVGPDEGGGKEVREHIRASASAHIRWLGPLPHEEVRRLLAKTQVLALPSVDEPYPMSVLEAMAHGVPVIVTESCGLASEIRTSGSGLVITDDIAALSAAMATLLLNKATRVSAGMNARRTAIESHDITAIGRRLASLYAEAVT